eukprot:5664572-Prymnesium_polylepis.2
MSTVDSTAWNRVGNDIGTQYRHGIYPHSDAQAAAAAAAIEREQARKDVIPGAAGMRKVVTEVRRASVFWPAEKHHREPAPADFNPRPPADSHSRLRDKRRVSHASGQHACARHL